MIYAASQGNAEYMVEFKYYLKSTHLFALAY